MKDIQRGSWKKILSAEEHKIVLDGFRVKKGKFEGPGNYLFIRWSQPCPRGCCYDDCGELMTSKDVIDEVKEQMLDLANILKKAKSG